MTKKFILTLFSTVLILSNLFSQTKNIELSQYAYHTNANNNNWRWISATYNWTPKKTWEYGVGLGYNITPVFIKESLFYSTHPRNKSFVNNVNLNLMVKRHFDLGKENVDLYIYDKLNLGRTSFYQTSVIIDDSLTYYENTYTNPQILVDNTLGLGLDVLIFRNIHFFTRIGLCVFYNDQSGNITKRNFSFNKEFGLKIAL